MGNYIGTVWRCRYFWLSLVKMDLRTRYRRSVLGLGWSLLHPIALTIIFCVVFRAVFNAKIEEYAPFVLTGLACWSFFVTSTLQGCQSFFQGESYIRQYPSPLAIYPLRTALGGIVHFLIALVVVLIMAWYFNGFSNLATLPSLVPSLLLMFLFGWSLSVLAGFANVYFQDTQHICEVSLQMMMYLTPIMYKLSMLKDAGLEWVMRFNPFVPFLTLIRDPILESRVPALETYVAAGLIVVLTTGAACLTLARLQRRLIFHL